MRKLLLKLIVFLFFLFFLFELLIRSLNLTNDVPSRTIDNNGLQSFIPNQKGVYNNNEWTVNNQGFLGQELKQNGQVKVLIIGDSMIENIMNDQTCHLDVLLGNIFKNKIDFFEIGRSGITLIESLEFDRKFKNILNPAYSIILVNKNDVEESISNISRYRDRLQLDIKTSNLDSVEIKYEKLKYFLYNIKSLYFLYMKGFFLSGNLFEKPYKFDQSRTVKNESNIYTFFEIIKTRYKLDNTIFLIDINQKKYIDHFKKIEANLILFSAKNEWLNRNDSHWNCIGNNEISCIISKHLKQLPDLSSY